jgi:hypothetical protein
VDQIADHRVFTPSFFFSAEHARQYADDSGQLENEEDNGADPPTHDYKYLLSLFFMIV